MKVLTIFKILISRYQQFLHDFNGIGYQGTFIYLQSDIRESDQWGRLALPQFLFPFASQRADKSVSSNQEFPSIPITLPLR